MHFQLNKSLFGGIFTLFTGTAAAQLVAILLQPFLRRMYLPEDFGAYSVYLSLVSILVTLSTLRYEPAIVQPEKKAEAVNLFFLAFYFNLIFSFILLLIVGFFRDSLAGFLNISKGQAWWLLFLPASVFLLGTYQTMNYYLIRKKRFKAISLNKGARRVAEGGVQMGLGAIRWPAGLVIGDVAGHVANVISGMFQLRQSRFKASLHSFPLQKRLIRQYSDYPLYSMLPMTLNTFCLMIPTIFINKFYSQEVAGYFDLTRLVLVVPSALLTMSVGQVFLQEVSEKKRKGLSFIREYKQLLGVLSILGLLFAVVLTLFGPRLLGLYAGAPYQESGRFAQLLVWGTLARVAVSPLTMVYVGLRKLKAQAAWQITYFALVCALVLFRNLPIMYFILILAAVEVIAYSINLLLINGIVKQYHRDIIEPVISKEKTEQEP
ncbi:MAG: lipopolysaccharide biosynthesis protein [Bacteroides sp.]|jgi:O-antigen/teichoic acid export membrane protein|nr:lipopolysaccharide biosynthesis protein [Bacteroides sp.]